MSIKPYDDIDRAVAEAEAIFVSAGRARAKAERLDQRRKSIRAALTVKYRRQDNPVGLSESMAEASKSYEAACDEWYEAALEAETLRAQAEARRMMFEAWRSKRAYERAEMGLR